MPNPKKPEDEIQDETPTIPRVSVFDDWKLKRSGAQFFFEYGKSGGERPASVSDALMWELMEEIRRSKTDLV